jgi:hypothetical protein
MIQFLHQSSLFCINNANFSSDLKKKSYHQSQPPRLLIANVFCDWVFCVSAMQVVAPDDKLARQDNVQESNNFKASIHMYICTFVHKGSKTKPGRKVDL